MRDPTLILDASEPLPFLAQARQSGAHAMPLPTSGLGQITDRGAVWSPQQRDDGGLLRGTGRRGRHACRRARLPGAAAGNSSSGSRISRVAVRFVAFSGSVCLRASFAGMQCDYARLRWHRSGDEPPSCVRALYGWRRHCHEPRRRCRLGLRLPGVQNWGGRPHARSCRTRSPVNSAARPKNFECIRNNLRVASHTWMSRPRRQKVAPSLGNPGMVEAADSNDEIRP